ncbi:nucleotidyltransferase family protein [Cohnella yongneupensis]|uniref:Nucleotidyltransferase family protein n=1 Tax=Cohnella yongneupensis TaxID=425006 RepID=A0ABW0QU46_9BACL
MTLEEKLKSILSTHKSLIRDLNLVKSLNMPNWCISAGYVRNFVWDYLHHYKDATPLNDVDVVYYDSSQQRAEADKEYEALLKRSYPDYNWSVKNQARMHVRKKESSYSSVEDAMERWPETVTAIGVSLDQNDHVTLVAPHGLNDLFELVIRRSPYFADYDYFIKRVLNKNWLNTWPKLRLIEE